MTIAVVSGQVATGSSGTSAVNSQQTAAFPSAVTTGNTLLVVVRGVLVTSAETVTIADSESNAYTCDLFNAYSSGSSDIITNPASTNVPASAPWVGIWRCTNATGGSGFKVTATIGSTVNAYLDVAAVEVSGAASSPVNATSYGAGASGSPATGSFSTTVASTLALVAFTGQGSAIHAPTITVPSGFTSLQSKTTMGTGDGDDGNASYEIFGSTQSGIDPTWTVTNIADWVSVAVAYAGAVSGTAPGQASVAVAPDATNPTTALDLTITAPSTGTTPFTYNILRAATLGGSYSTIATGVSSTSYVDTTCTAANEYAYQVEAVNSYGTGTASTAAAYGTAPAPPTLTATPVSPTQINLTLAMPTLGSNIQASSPAFYVEQENPPGAGNWSVAYNGNSTSPSVTGLSPSTQYGFKASCFIESSNSDWSGTPESTFSSELDVASLALVNEGCFYAGANVQASGLVSAMTRPFVVQGGAVMHAANW